MREETGRTLVAREESGRAIVAREESGRAIVAREELLHMTSLRDRITTLRRDLQNLNGLLTDSFEVLIILRQIDRLTMAMIQPTIRHQRLTH